MVAKIRLSPTARTSGAALPIVSDRLDRNAEVPAERDLAAGDATSTEPRPSVFAVGCVVSVIGCTCCFLEKLVLAAGHG